MPFRASTASAPTQPTPTRAPRCWRRRSASSAATILCGRHAGRTGGAFTLTTRLQGTGRCRAPAPFTTSPGRRRLRSMRRGGSAWSPRGCVRRPLSTASTSSRCTSGSPAASCSSWRRSAGPGSRSTSRSSTSARSCRCRRSSSTCAPRSRRPSARSRTRARSPPDRRSVLYARQLSQEAPELLDLARIEGGEDLLRRLVGDGLSTIEHPLPLSRQMDRVLAAIPRMRPALRVSELLELVDDGHHRAWVDERTLRELLLSQSLLSGDQSHDAEMGGTQPEVLQRFGEHRRGPPPVPREKEPGRARERLWRGTVESHLDGRQSRD